MKTRKREKRSRVLKRLRRLSEQATVGKKYAEYKTVNKKGTSILTEDCTRGAYLKLKRQFDQR